MARVYFPGCMVRRRYPEASEWLAGQVVARGWADEVAGCCRVDHQKLAPGDDAGKRACMNCMAMIDEDAANGGMASIWQLVDADPGFPLPDYSGHVMGVQDCGRAYDRAGVQESGGWARQPGGDPRRLHAGAALQRGFRVADALQPR